MKTFGIFNTLYAPAITEEDGSSGDVEEIEESEEDSEQESEDDEDEENEEPVVDSKITDAVRLYDALNDPAKAPGLLAYLNAQLGGGVKASDLKDINLADLIKTELGEENEWLAPKLTSILEKSLSKAIERELAPLRAQIQETELRAAEVTITNALDPIIDEMGQANFDKLAPKLAEIMKKYPNQGQPIKSYVRDMIKIARGEDKTPSSKIMRNIRDAKRPTTGINTERVKTGSKLPTHRESIQAALKGITLDR